MAEHISIFMENKPGRLNRVTGILAEAGINLRAFSTSSSSGGFGILKMLADDPERACELLTAKNISAVRKEIVVCMIDDSSGSLHQILELLSANGLNVEDSYGFLFESGKSAAIVIESSDLVSVKKVLTAGGIRLLSDEEVYTL